MWSVYLLECSDGTYYTGITTDIDRRLKKHQAGKASKYTRARRPVRVIYLKPGYTQSDALREERRIKALDRKAKERLVDLSSQSAP